MIPTDYRKEQKQLIYDLIEQSNPGFKAKYPLGSLTFGAPSAITVDSADPYLSDTEVMVTPVAGSGANGFQTFKYRRIDIAVLFRDMILQLNSYVASGLITRAAWIAELSNKYGISVVDSDFPSGYQNLTSGILSQNLQLTATGLCYKGYFHLRWTQGKKPILQIIPDNKADLIGRTYPDGNDFPANRKPQGEWLTYGVDLSNIKTSANLDSAAPSYTVPINHTGAIELAIIAELKNQTGRSNWSLAESGTEGGLGGLTWYKYTLPSASLPEGNPDFNRALVVQSAPGSWFQGKIIIHWKQ